jgi:Spy/CpxP family protein refolding chaperone
MTKTIQSVLALSVLLLASMFGSAAAAQQQQQADVQQAATGQDPITKIMESLTPEQREKIRAIREQNKEDRAAINQRFRETNRALEEALEADNPNEAIIEQRLRDFAAAQASQMRMRVLTEVRIRQVLTPEQQNTLRVLRQQVRDSKRAREFENLNERRRALDRLPQRNQRNGLGPLLRRPNDPARKPRP